MNEQSALQDYLNELGKQVTGEIRTDLYSRMFYSTDASIYQVMPHGVLIPKTVEDVHAAVEMAAKYEMPILPRGAGSSLAGQAVNEALVIDMSRHLDQILEVNAEENWARVQPGLVLDEFNIHLQRYGLQFGPDPASSDRATMGGIVSNNSTGAHSILYGMTADHILETNVILSDGTLTGFGPLVPDALNTRIEYAGMEGAIYRRVLEVSQQNEETIRAGTPRHWRRCGGYNLDRFIAGGVTYQVKPDPRFNLARLICGAEGTLSVMTEMKVNLVPRPTKTALAIVHFDSLNEALTAVPVILKTNPSAVELLDNLGLTMCRDVPEYARLLTTFIKDTPNCVLITEFYGENEMELHSKIEHLKSHLRSNKAGSAIVPAIDPQLQKNVWTVRKVGLGLLMSIKGDHKPIPFIEDAAVPVEHLAEYVSRIEQFCNDLGAQVAYYAHASAGCLHVRPLINTKIATDVDKLEAITTFSVELLGKYGGAFSSEHGDGHARSWLNEKFFGAKLYALFKEVKGTFDPKNILNPGNVVDAPAMTDNLRFGADYETVSIQTNLDFSHEMGFHRAIEMCNGAGICRKKTTGIMCPSFMVTREEEHSTRGRANALRAAISGLIPLEELTSPRMHQVMDLCIECKACKAECPSSVDMAKIKFEFLAQYHKVHGVPLRARLFADIARLNRLTSGLLAPLANSMLGNSLVQRGLEQLLGISHHRQMPDFARQPFTKWFEKRQRAADRAPKTRETAAPRPQSSIVLFNDTFNTFNHPETAIAATEVLEAAGFEVVLPGHKCCGRPMISKGLVDKAHQAAQDTVEHLAPFAEQGIPIVGLEPSCLLTLRDEYSYLLPDNPQAEMVAEHTYMFEEFITKLTDENQLDLTFSDEARHILLHGHCHQKSLVGTGPSKHMLTLPPNYTLKEVDSSCCGMAGSFGYEAEHYVISMKMAERRLLPTVREQDSETLIVAAGVSCRSQIEHGTGRQALHPAEVLRNALVFTFR